MKDDNIEDYLSSYIKYDDKYNNYTNYIKKTKFPGIIDIFKNNPGPQFDCGEVLASGSFIVVVEGFDVNTGRYIIKIPSCNETIRISKDDLEKQFSVADPKDIVGARK